MIGLDQLADVFTEGDNTYDVPAKVGLRCRLSHINSQPATSGSERAELAAIRNMLWEPGYVMPENCQVVVAGVRWQPRAGSFGAYRGPRSQLVYRRCDLVRQS